MRLYFINPCSTIHQLLLLQLLLVVVVVIDLLYLLKHKTTLNALLTPSNLVKTSGIVRPGDNLPGFFSRVKRVARVTAKWTLITGTLSGLLLWLFQEDIEALDRLDPPRQLTLSSSKKAAEESSEPATYKGIPIIDYETNGDTKPRLVVLGTGWGSVSMLKNLERGAYEVWVVSPTNYFLFTPLIPSDTVGTVELRSLLEPIRKVMKRVRGIYIEVSGIFLNFFQNLWVVNMFATIIMRIIFTCRELVRILISRSDIC